MASALAPECLETRTQDSRAALITAARRSAEKEETPDFRRILDAPVAACGWAKVVSAGCR